jgi:hypothetical protein
MTDEAYAAQALGVLLVLENPKAT